MKKCIWNPTWQVWIMLARIIGRLLKVDMTEFAVEFGLTLKACALHNGPFTSADGTAVWTETFGL